MNRTHPMPPNPLYTDSQFNAEKALQATRVIGAIFGFVLIIIGLTLLIQMFLLIKGNISSPEELNLATKTWLENIDGNFEIKSNGQTVVPETLVVLLLVLIMLSLLIQICVGLIGAGVKLISSTTSEKEAIKKILEHSLGTKHD
jgi:hypothetical protein